LAVDSVGNVYVADAGSGYVHKFDPRGTPLLSFHDPLLKTPAGIAVSESGAIYVTDRTSNRLFIFFPDGKRYRTIRSGRQGLLRSPSGVAVDFRGNLFVVDSGGMRVNQFNSRRRSVASWRVNGEASAKDDVPSDLAVGPDGDLYIAVVRGNRLQMFGSGRNAPPIKIPSPSPQISAPGEWKHVGLSISDRHIFVVGAAPGRVLAWAIQGTWAEEFRPAPADSGPASAPDFVDVAWSPRGELFILDSSVPRVLRFRIHF